ncbi:SDR family NAD(P)-dependent oxidoreductase [Saccharopolyspora sp. NFXS83]|uniref:SDR family NAD(P)-dependent oxidoreductase n=1 Tax=Saccharopolyspora sp. NFXS83 TaxID=2993560 RepID=UPI00224B425D|nr:SDR family NAD(P)-dependent oxidoreductase [Saccharopolyspora sp. NFXS83]MCX2729176.1 SDR family NAD(P)-dependent oxidoreductase [Saccharopolyspora sp. NFXS83]
MSSHRTITCTVLLTGDNPLVDDHRVHGVRTLPGVTFLDLVHRTLAEHDFPLERTELRDVLFVEPAVIGDGFDRELHVELLPDGTGHRVVARSRVLSHGAPLDEEWTRHLEAWLHYDAPPVDRVLGERPDGEVIDVEQVYARGRAAEIEHREFMRCHGVLREDPGGLLADIALGSEAAAGVEDFLLHPALLDGSTMQAYALAFDGEPWETRPLIPLHIESFRAWGPLGDRCLVDLRVIPARGDDVFRADLALHRPDGRQAALFTGLSLKRVRTRASITRLASLAESGTARSEAEGASPALPEIAGPGDAPLTSSDEPVRAAGADLAAVRREVAAVVRDVAEDPELDVDPERGFYDLGLESAQLLALVRAMEARWHIDLYPTLLFEYPTPGDVSEYLLDVLPGTAMPDPALRGHGPGHIGTGAADVADVPFRPARPGGSAEPGEGGGSSLSGAAFVLQGRWERAEPERPQWTGTLLVVGARRDFVEGLACPAVVARPGDAFREVSAHEYEIRPDSADDLRRLLAELAGQGLAPSGVLHLGPQETPDVAEAVERACAEVLALVQALSARPGREHSSVVHVSGPLVAAAVAGMARTVRLEQPRVTLTAIECHRLPDAERLLGELAAHGEPWVRHDDGGRFVRRYAEVTLGEPQVRDGGVYLISGGAGGIGRALAAGLAATARARLVLFGRTEPSEQVRAELTELGARVHFVRADVTDERDVRRVVAEARARFGPINGVVHAAGVLRDGLLPAKSGDSLRQVLAPKVRGAVVLDEATRDEQLDFFALLSSVTGVAGNVGQIDYAAANGFLDAYARQRGMLSVAWPLWADGGMRTDPAAQELFRSQGQVPLPTRTGVDLFTRAVGHRGAELVVLHGDRDRVPGALGLAPSVAEHSAPAARDDIAIIGLAGRYPESDGVDGFWENLIAGRDCVSEIPPERWPLAGFYDSERKPGRSTSRWGGFLSDVDKFDPQFFRITPLEAAGMDPQERLFLETSWHTLEDAGVSRSELAGRAVGVFVGVMFNQYQMLGADQPGRVPVLPTSFSSSVANRVSYFLDLHGPSLALDTMCSSSLTAIHLACQSLRAGDCELALAGGVNVAVHPYKYLHLSQVGFVSSDGRCRSFGAGGDGYVPGEGVGAVLLKPLSRALADGDRVHAVIRGSQVNHGGRASGFFAPNPAAQADLVRRAWQESGLAPESIDYLEAHGTGTALGDPIELSALSQAFGSAAPGTCPIGSVKSAIGHLESAAGIAGLTKVLLQLRHRTLAPSLHADPANPEIDWDSSPFRVQRVAEPWRRRGGQPLRAGVSAFGAGGSNAHLVIEEFRAPEPAADEPGNQVVLLSARKPENLRALAQRYFDAFDAPPRADAVEELSELLSGLFGLTGGALDPEAGLDELGLDAADLRTLEGALAERVPARTGALLDVRSTVAELAEQFAAVDRARESASAPRHRISAGGRPPSLSDVAYTSQRGREAMGERLAFVVGTPAELRMSLGNFLDGNLDGRTHRGTVRPGAEPDQTAADRASAAGDPGGMAQAWVAGAVPDWRRSRRGDRRRVALPLYPFTRMRCWVTADEQVSTDEQVAPEPTTSTDPGRNAVAAASVRPDERGRAAGAEITEDRPTGAGPRRDERSDRAEQLDRAAGFPHHIAVWEPKPAAAAPVPRGPVLIIHTARSTEVAGELAAHHRDDEVRFAELGDRTRRKSAGHWEFDPRGPDFAAELGVPRTIYFLGGVTSPVRDATEVQRVRHAEESGVLALHRFARQWIDVPGLEWRVVTTDVWPVAGVPARNPYPAGLAGFARVLEHEHPSWSVPVLDLESAATPAESAARIVAEPAERGVRAAVRAGVRHRAVLRSAPPEEVGGTDPVRAGGAYVVVGGAGGIGMEIARFLLDRGGKVALIGRSGLGEEREARLAALDRGRTGLRYVQADATDPVRLRAALDEVCAEWGPLTGVVHAALSRHDRLVRNLDEPELVASLAAKSGVAAALIDVLRDRPVDFLLLFSSAQSLLGDAGLANYAAGSAFLDAYAHALDGTLPFRVRVIDWGLWGTVGSASGAEERARLVSAGFRSISPDEGWRTVLRSLRGAQPQLVAVPGTRAMLERLGVMDGPAAGNLTPDQQRTLAEFHELDREMTEVAASRLLQVLDGMGAWDDGGAPAAAIVRRIGTTSRYERLVHEVLALLGEAGLVSEHDGAHRPEPHALAAARATDHGTRFAALAERHPGGAVFVRLLAHCLARYPELLRGDLLATDLLFPSSGTSLMAGIYKDNPVSDVYNELLAARVLRHVERLLASPPGRPIRVLEVGSGTGGTSDGLLRALHPHGEHVEYWYTDLSVAFLEHGRREYGDRHPFCEFRRLDLDTDLTAQGFPAGRFDVVVGANVLHATRDLRRALRHLRVVLRPGGLLLLNELTAVTAQATAVYGLFDGWWTHDDAELRLPGSPLLDLGGWNSVLTGLGYADVRGIPEGTDRNFQHVIEARADEAAPDPEEERGPQRRGTSGVAGFGAEVLELVARTSAIPAEDLDVDRPIGDYGFDSVSYSLLATKLNEEHGFDVTPALFYETATLRALIDRLAADRPVAAGPDESAQDAPASGAPEPVASRTGEPASAQRESEGPRQSDDSAALAIVGVAGTLPGSRDLDDFWRHLVSGDDLISEVPPDRWDWRAQGPGVHARWGGFVDGVDLFDPLFFGISPREAAAMDPQHRLVLQTTWSALEDAGIAPGGLAGSDTGVFLGAGSHDYEHLQRAAGAEVDSYAATSNTHSILVNRISYLLDLHGPSEPVNTGCSSSLVALHRAAQSIRAGECEVAVVGGVNLLLSPHDHALLSSTGMLSPTGRSRAFDAAADGFVRGEGVGVVVLTTRRRAEADRHRVRGWLRGSAVNHGGRARSLTAPNPAAQAAMIVRAHECAGIDPATVGYVETHGTGTELGDPIEINGLVNAFRELHERAGGAPVQPHCGLGALKADIGHLESAAGVAGVLKVLLAMRHGVLPPLGHLERPNPHLRLEGTPFHLVREAAPWPRAGAPRRAGVSSFGYGGVNAHVVLEEAGEPATADGSSGPWIFPLSARTPQALLRQAANLRDHLIAHREAELVDVARTLQVGRDAMEHRLAVVAPDRERLLGALAAVTAGEAHPDLVGPGGTAQDDPAHRRARSWVGGTAVEWSAERTGGHLVPLPTYPFERRRCWFTEGDLGRDRGADSADVGSDPDVPAALSRAAGDAGEHAVPEVRTHVPRWVPCDPPRRAPDAGAVWLVAGADAEPLAGAVTARCGSDRVIRLRPDELDEETLTGLPAPASVLFLPDLDEDCFATPAGAATQLARHERTGVLALFRLIRHLVRRPAGAGELALTVVTADALPIGPVLAPWSASLRGLLKSVRRECERWHVTTADLARAEVFDDPDGAASELGALASGEFARRDGQWWEQELHPLALTGDGTAFRAGGAYLIVGGAGDIGLDLAEHLVREHGAKVCLIGRSEPDAARRSRIAAWDPTGEHVRYVRADAVDPVGLRTAIDEFAARAGRLHGVVHAANELRDGALAELDERAVAAGLAKTRTTVALADAVADLDLDFLVLFSSVQSFLGNPGQSSYAAASAFQDACAHALQTALPFPVHVVNWGAWAGSGLAVEHAARLARAGVHPIPPAAGIAALSRLIGQQEVQVAVVSGSERFLSTLGVRDPVRAAGVPDVPPGADNADEVPGAAPAEWVPALRADLHGLVCSVAGLGPAELGLETELRLFGFDSITYTQLSNRVNVAFELDLTPAFFFGIATTADLADKLVRDHVAALARHYGEFRRPEPSAAPEGVRKSPPVDENGSERSRRETPGVAGTAQECTDEHGDAVAVVGMAGMLPGSADLAEFWAHLVAGDDLITEIPADRWAWRSLYGDPESGEFRTWAKWGGFLPRVDLFDPLFFGISPKEAAAMDPQHRLVLQAVWSAIEDAAIRPSALSGTDTGVFLGCGTYDYFEVQHAFEAPLDGYNTVGRAHAMLSNRVSYLLDLHGPSETVDTACSSSLVALHRAAESIRHGDCDLAFAGGVNVIASPTLFVDMSRADMLSPDGRCRTFDAGANGIARAEGVGIVLLKRMSAAVADGDVIHGVIRGSAINHGGRTNSLTAPNPDAQAACVVRAHRRSGVDPRRVGYVETHGTGTSLGDPVEVEGLKSAFATLYRDRGADVAEQHIALGAVKSNAGHLEAGAGITGLLKVLLAMRHGTFPGNLHIDQINPHVRLDGSPLRILRGTEPWHRSGGERRIAGVSSFGLGGVNAHVVVEEAPDDPTVRRDGPDVFVLSAKDPQRLRAYAERIVRWLDRDAPDGLDLPTLCRTAQAGRDAMPQRLAAVAADLPGLRVALAEWLGGRDDVPGVVTGDAEQRDSTATALLEGPEGAAYLRAVFAARRLDKLAVLWTGGVDLDWDLLWSGEAPRRVPMPTYPFAEESYWITPGERFRGGDAQPPPVRPVVEEPAAEPTRAAQPESAPPRAEAARAEAAPPGEEPAPTGDFAGVRARITALLASHLGLDPARLRQDRVLTEFGVDSLGMRRLSRRLGAEYGIDIPARLFTTGRTINALAAELESRFGSQLRSAQRPPAPEVLDPAGVPGPARHGGSSAATGGGAEDGADPTPAGLGTAVPSGIPTSPGSETPDESGSGARSSGPAAPPDAVGRLLAGLRDGRISVDDALAELQQEDVR